MSIKTQTRTETSAGAWLPAGLMLLGLVPVLAGAFRMTELATNPAGAPSRFAGDPLPVVLHAAAAIVYTLLGAFQFAPRLRRRRPRWHRLAGRVLVPSGLVVALTGVWMVFSYGLFAVDGALLAGFRLVFGLAMAVSITLGLGAVLRRDFTSHRAWMMRGYALGLGAGTQAVVMTAWTVTVGSLDELPRALLHLTGWVVNLAVAGRGDDPPLPARLTVRGYRRIRPDS